MWPFRKKKHKELGALLMQDRVYVLASCDGVVESVMYDYLVIAGEKHYCKAPLVGLGHTVKKGQPVGK